MNNELANTILTIAWQYRRAERPLPDHVRADLLDVARCDSIAHRLRSDAARLLEVSA